MALRPPPAERDPTQLLEFGVVNLDKPGGPTSHQVSAWVSDLTGIERAGHVGTLDPSVTGCLPVLLGNATRLASTLTEGSKAYVAILELHGEPPEDWRASLDRFQGEIYQRPPRKSAVVRRLRTRRVESITVLERDDRRVLLKVDCEAGTYVRKLCHDLGLAIGTGGHMASLRRIESTPFDDRSLSTLYDLADAIAFWREDGDEEPLRSVVQPAEVALDHLPTLSISPSTAEAVADGAPVYAPGVVEAPDGLDPADDTVVACRTPAGVAVCVGRLVGDPDDDHGTVVDLERVLV